MNTWLHWHLKSSFIHHTIGVMINFLYWSTITLNKNLILFHFSWERQAAKLKMFKFLRFNWLLKFIYLTIKLSGFLYISIDFESEKVKLKKQLLNIFVVLTTSFGLSFIANTYDGYLPVADVTHSGLLDMGLNFALKSLIWLACLMKIANIVQSNRFFESLSILQWNERKVSRSINLKLSYKILLNTFFHISLKLLELHL